MYSQCTVDATVCSAKASMYLRIAFFIDSLVHGSNLSISGFRVYSWLVMYFPADRKAKESINNT